MRPRKPVAVWGDDEACSKWAYILNLRMPVVAKVNPPTTTGCEVDLYVETDCYRICGKKVGVVRLPITVARDIVLATVRVALIRERGPER